MADPANRLPPEYDDIQPPHYDPIFTANISTQMRVPDKLGVVNEYEQGQNPEGFPGHGANMNVPDRILVAGQDKHIGMREELRLDDLMTQAPPQFVGLSTPPRILTLDEQFPPEGEDPETRYMSQSQNKSLTLPNGYVSATHDYSDDQELLEFAEAAPGDSLLIAEDIDDVTLLRRQVGKLTRHVIHLEEENAKRSQRELILYPLIIGYFLFQVAKLFLRTN